MLRKTQAIFRSFLDFNRRFLSKKMAVALFLHHLQRYYCTADNQMNRVKLFHPVKTISAEDAEKNSSNLSELLRFQSQVFIKENGRGAVSSPS
ncbi:hypothetical protein BOQ60_25265, partial [Chryseobacterium sp. CH1]